MKKSSSTRLDREKLVENLIIYLEDEMELTPTSIGVEGLLDHVVEIIGKPHYQKGLLDAQKVMTEKLDEANDRIFVLQTL